MIIKGNNLKMYYHVSTKNGSYFDNLNEIKKEQYGYELKEGNKVICVRYDGELVNREMYIYPTIVSASKEGLTISDDSIEKSKNKMLPWVKDGCNLCVKPCERLYKEMDLKKLLQDFKENNLDSEGIWHKDGGWRTSSSPFKENLKYFIELGQKSFLQAK